MDELIKTALNHVTAQIGDKADFIGTAKQFIEGRFGTAGLIACGLLLASILGLLLAKLTKLSFDLLRYVAVPSVAVTFVATYFLPYSFVYILPVAVAFFAIVLIVKG